MTKLKLISDGTNKGTKVVDAKTGRRIKGVTEITFYHVPGEKSRLTITVEKVQAADIPKGIL